VGGRWWSCRRQWGRLFISALFVLETFGYCCIQLIIEGENLRHLLAASPVLAALGLAAWGRDEFMCFAAALFLPTVMIRNLNILSYVSGLGVLSSVRQPPRPPPPLVCM
jgi:amino acid permease